MSKQAKTTTAQKLVHSLVRIIPGAHEENLQTVRRIRSFILDPNGSANLLGIPAPHHQDVPDWVPFTRGQFITQAVPVHGETPAYLLPLPGQAAAILGGPDQVDMDGAIWDAKAGRWTNVKDLRILVNTPDGVTVATVESSDFVAFTPETRADQETVDSAVAILDELEKRILDAQLEDSQKPAPETQEEGLENE